MRFRVRRLSEVASTNTLVKRAIDEGEPEGLAVRADRQTGGYGRQGRTWQSPEGGLYFSLLLRPGMATASVPDGSGGEQLGEVSDNERKPSRSATDSCGRLDDEPRGGYSACQLPTLALLAGIAVRRALARLVGGPAANRIKLKWPNDIVVAGVQPGAAFAKLCGISSEARKGAVCVGIGVNVYPPNPGAQALPSSKNSPVYLADLMQADSVKEGLRDRAFSLILEEFAPLYEQWCAKGFAPFAEEYAQHDALRGRRVDVVDRSGSPLASGVASGVGADGCLLIASADGILVPVASGEAHIL